MEHDGLFPSMFWGEVSLSSALYSTLRPWGPTHPTPAGGPPLDLETPLCKKNSAQNYLAFSFYWNKEIQHVGHCGGNFHVERSFVFSFITHSTSHYGNGHLQSSWDGHHWRCGEMLGKQDGLLLTLCGLYLPLCPLPTPKAVPVSRGCSA